MNNTYDITNITNRLVEGESESAIADELSRMLNQAATEAKAKKAAQEAARAAEEKEKLRKAKELRKTNDIEYISQNFGDLLMDFINLFGSVDLIEEVTSNVDNFYDNVRKFVAAFVEMLPLYEELYKIERKFAGIPNSKEESNNNKYTPKLDLFGTPIDNKHEAKLAAKAVDKVSDKELDKMLKSLADLLTAKG